MRKNRNVAFIHKKKKSKQTSNAETALEKLQEPKFTPTSWNIASGPAVLPFASCYHTLGAPQADLFSYQTVKIGKFA